MARSRRRSFAKRAKADWVFRGNVFDDAGSTVDDGGTYEPGAAKLQQPGPGNANAGILYESSNRLANAFTSGGNIITALPRVARAEGRKAKILRVMGSVIVTPSLWALGSRYLLGFRFGMFEQDPLTGALLLDVNYSMWQLVTTQAVAPAVWANDRAWQHERHIAVGFNDNSDRRAYTFNFRVNRNLAPNFCYAVYTETAAGSVNLTLQFMLRTLVVDEG